VRAAAENTADQIAELMKFGDAPRHTPSVTSKPALSTPHASAPMRAAAASFSARRVVARRDGRRSIAAPIASAAPKSASSPATVQIDLFER